MVKIEELMEHGTRRKVEGIAAEMGFPKAVEYPDEVLEEVKRRSTTTNSKKRSVSAKAQETAEQQTANSAEEDLKSVNAAAENRAAGLLVALDSLTMLHCATRKFSDTNLQNAVDESQSRLKQMLAGVALVYDPEAFLAQTPLAQIAPGENGLTRSLPGSSNPSSASEPSANGKGN